MTDNGIFPEENKEVLNQSSQVALSTEENLMESAQLPVSSQPAAHIASVRNFQVGQGQTSEPEKKNLFWWVLAGMAAIVLLSFAFFSWQMAQREPEPTTTPQTQKIVLNYWGLWEHSATLTEALAGFEAENPGVTVKYTKKNITNYRQDLTEAFSYAGMNAPDVFRFHASWRSMFDKYLAPVPAAVISKKNFASEYYPVMTQQLTDLDGELKGLPLMYDGLALVYNREIFAKYKAEVPKSWPEFRLLAKRLTQIDEETGRIIQSGAALGLMSNVDFASDIIGLFGAQRGIDWANPQGSIALDAILYYLSFYKNEDSQTWDELMPNSTQAFAEGKVAMIFAPSWLIHDILKLNPVLPVGVASVPQLDEKNPVDWATYWVEGVNRNTSYQEAAWRLLQYLSREQVLEKLNYEQKISRDFGEIYPKIAMADKLAQDKYVHAYLVNAYHAVGFPLNDKTFDHGINEALIKKLTTLVNSYSKNDDYQEFLEKLKSSKPINIDWVEELIEYNYIADPKNK